jgi:hypothetical protein
MRELGLVLKNEKEMKDIAEAMTKRDKIYLRGLEFAKENLREICELDPKLYVIFRRVLSVVRLEDQDYLDYWEISRKITDVLREAYERGKGKNPRVY